MYYAVIIHAISRSSIIIAMVFTPLIIPEIENCGEISSPLSKRKSVRNIRLVIYLYPLA